MKIVHCADIHLGRRRLDGRLADQDFAVALQHIVERAIEWKADVFLIAGDLFDLPQIPPPVLRQATEALAPLKKANVPVIAIEGNHDRSVFNRTHPTWMSYLHEENLLTLLSTPFTAEGPQLSKYDPKTGIGSYLELGGVRFVGAGYLGAGTDRKAHAIASALPEDSRPNVMLLHAGPDYFVGEGGGFRKETLNLLQSRIEYLALGHIHKPMMYGGEAGRAWAINPGSPENCRLDEADQSGPRGWAEVEMDPKALPGLKLLHSEIKACPRRPVVRVDFDITPFGNKLKEGEKKIREEAAREIKELKIPPECIIRLYLTGELNIGRIGLEPHDLASKITEDTGVAGIEVNMSDLRLYTGRPGTARTMNGLTTAEIENMALVEILRQKPLADLEEEVEPLAELYCRIREEVARGASREAIIEILDTSTLPDLIVEREKTVLG